MQQRLNYRKGTVNGKYLYADVRSHSPTIVTRPSTAWEHGVALHSRAFPWPKDDLVYTVQAGELLKSS